MQDYTKSQQEDIEKRIKSAEVYLKGLNLFPSAVVQKVNIGDDQFVDKVICYLQDTKFTPIKSPMTDDFKAN